MSKQTSALAAFGLAGLAPCIWGSTYIVFKQTLPIDSPLLVAAFRVLPAGILLMLLGAGLPPRRNVGAIIALGIANIAAFHGLLFIGASRLPSGIAATLNSSQPMFVAFVAWPLIGIRPSIGSIAAATIGIAGVALLVVQPDARGRLDPVGVAAAMTAALSMGVGTVLLERWKRLGTPMQISAWQLTAGGVLLLPLGLSSEALPSLTLKSGLGFAYLILVGSALAYWAWIKGVSVAGSDAAFLLLLSPLTATLLGVCLSGEHLGGAQVIGIVMILVATVVGLQASNRRRKSGALAGC